MGRKSWHSQMLMLKEAEWIQIFNESGLSMVPSWRANSSKDWSGTLVLTGKKVKIKNSWNQILGPYKL